MTTTPSQLQLTNVTKRFGGVVAVNDVSLEVAAGELVGVIGPNGAGKSTLLSLISGGQRPTSGEVRFEEHRIDRMKGFRVARLGIGRAHQIPRPFRRMTVRENLLVASHAAAEDPTGHHDSVDQVLELCAIADRAQRPAGSLTLLDLKRLEVARALALRPRLLLLDEVAAGLVGKEIDQITELVRGVNARGITVLLIEHVQALVQELAQRVFVLDWGRLIAQGTPQEVAANEEVVRVYLGSTAVQEEAVREHSHHEGRKPMVQVEGLRVTYGPLPALRDVDVEMGEGEIVAMLGANGAGKSSLARAIAGLAPIAAGRVRLDGEDVTATPPHKRARAGIAICHEGRRLFKDLTVRENLELAVAYSGRGETPLAERLERIYALFPILRERESARAGEFSGGQQQMLAIGRALITEPRVVIFDELSLGLAPQVVDEIYAALREVRSWGVTVLLIEQSVYRALAVADRVYVMERGEVSFVGTPEELARDERLVEAYFGSSKGARTADVAAVPGEEGTPREEME